MTWKKGQPSANPAGRPARANYGRGAGELLFIRMGESRSPRLFLEKVMLSEQARPDLRTARATVCLLAAEGARYDRYRPATSLLRDRLRVGLSCEQSPTIFGRAHFGGFGARFATPVSQLASQLASQLT
jgi:hypothetical protein